MDIIEILSILIALTNFVIGIVVLLRVEKRSISMVYAVCVFCIGAWVLATVFYNLSVLLEPISWLKIIYIISYLMTITQSFFAYYFPRRIKDSFWKYFFLVFVTIIPSAYYLLFSDLVIVDVVHYPEINMSVAEMGGAYWIYILPNVLGLFLMSVYFLRKASKFRGHERAQIRLYVLGALLMYFPIIIIDYFYPLLTGDTRLYKYGPIFVLFYTILVAYSIAKQRFLGIKNLLSQFLYYSVVLTALTSVFYVTYFVVGYLFDSILSVQAVVFIYVLLSVLLVLLMNLKNQFRRFIDREITYRRFDPAEMLKKFSQTISTELEIDRIAENAIGLIRMSLKVDRLGVIVYKKSKNHGVSLVSRHMSNMFFTEDGGILEDVVSSLGCVRDGLYIYEEIDSLIDAECEKSDSLESIKEFMKASSLKDLIHFGQADGYGGLILLGERFYDEPLSTGEVQFILKVRDILSIAVTRAILYKDVKNFNISLQTEVDQATSKIQAQLAQLQESREKERNMIDIMGHELRTPATIINLNVGLLDRYWSSLFPHINHPEKTAEEMKEKYDKYMDRLKDGISREIKLINILLASAKIDGDKIVLNKEKVDISHVIEMSIHAYERDAKNKNILIRYENAEDLGTIEQEWDADQTDRVGKFGLPLIFADKVRIFEIVDNLISNAVKYTEKGEVTVSVRDLKNELEISVKDTGVGIPEDELKRLGEKFYRVGQYTGNYKEDSDTVKNHLSGDSDSENELKQKFNVVRPGGTGLGLYVAIGLIKEHGGKFNVESEVGKGSKFSFTIKKFNPQIDNKEGDASKTKDVFAQRGLKPKK